MLSFDGFHDGTDDGKGTGTEGTGTEGTGTETGGTKTEQFPRWCVPDDYESLVIGLA